MIAGLALCALTLLYLPALARPIGRRLAPREWAAIATGAIRWGAAATGLALLAVAVPTVLEAVGVRDLTRLCDQLLGHLPHVAPMAGWGAAVLLAGSLAAAGFALARTRAGLESLGVEPGTGEHVPMGSFDLVVLPTEAPVAYSRAGNPQQVVVSQGVVRSLTERQLAMLVHHEHTHLVERHERTLVLLASLQHALRWLPGLRASMSAARLSLERVADEEAAGKAVASRLALASALLATAGPSCESVAAFSAAEGLEERIRAMRGELRPLPALVARLLRGSSVALRGAPAILTGLLMVCLR